MNKKQVAKFILDILCQYAGIRLNKAALYEEKGKIYFDHMNMSTGEALTDFFEEQGLAIDEGYRFVLTDKGKKLLDE